VISVAIVNPGVMMRRRSAYFRSRIKLFKGDSSRPTSTCKNRFGSH
jgi:hypothetical protein